MITRENYEIWFLDYAEGRLTPQQRELLFAFLKKNPDLKKQLESFESVSFDANLSNETPSLNLKKKKSWLLEKYAEEELVFHVSEGNLNPEEQREWKDLCQYMPELAIKAEKEKQFVLQPQKTEAFESKSFLKKNEEQYLLTTMNCNAYFIQYAETKELRLHKAIQEFLVSYPEFKKDFDLSQRLTLQPDLSVRFDHKDSLSKKERMVAFYVWRAAAVAACILLAVFFFYPSNQSNTPSLADKSQNKEQGKPNENKIPLAPENDEVNENIADNNVQPVEQKSSIQRRKNQKNDGVNQNERKEDKNNANLEEEKIKPEYVEVPKNNNKKDTVATHKPDVIQKNEDNLANNKSNVSKNDQPIERPMEFVAKVINTKYYESETPSDKVSSPYYAMKNVVHSASDGQADIVKKEDKDYKTFGFKIGEFEFSRKRSKNRAEE